MVRETERTGRLALEDVSVRFGGLAVLESVDLSFGARGMNVLIGPNGAGKTTVLNALSGVLRPARGVVALDGEDVTACSEMRLARRGIVRKFQVPTVFDGMTVLDNLRVAVLAPRGQKRRQSMADLDSDIRSLAKTLNLGDRLGVRAAELSHGERQWLEIGMAFLGEPRFLLLDEPAAGLGPGETRHTADLIKLMSRGCCVLVVEHDMDFVRELDGEVTVLHQGRILTRGTMDEIELNSDVRDVYLGRGV
jgi:urea transport system ATP-binding protein